MIKHARDFANCKIANSNLQFHRIQFYFDFWLMNEMCSSSSVKLGFWNWMKIGWEHEMPFSWWKNDLFNDWIQRS